MKPKVLIIADFPNWAYYEIQQFIKENISDEFDIYCDFLIFNTIKKTKNPLKNIELLVKKYKYQQVHSNQNYDIVVYLGYYFTEYMKINWKAKKVIKGIFTDGFPPKNANFSGNLEAFKKRFLNDANAVVCGSNQILSRYKGLSIKMFFANMALNENIFKRKSEKKINKSKKFIVGWTGNPKREFKGFYSHIIPAITKAKSKYTNIQLKTQFSGSIDSLADFYEDVDVVVIASDADAGPSSFGEAALMEVPSISTDIGWPHEVIKNGTNGFLIEKDIDEITNKIIELYEDRQLLYKFSKNIKIDFLKVFNKNKMIQDWKNMFHELLKN